MIYMWTVISLKLDDRWLPKSVICLREYSLNKFLQDVIAGITVGLVALPLAMAFAIASGLTPQAGHLLRGGDGLSDLRTGRIEDSDWRAHRRVRSRGSGDRRRTRH